jgi:hypothetical protein
MARSGGGRAAVAAGFIGGLLAGLVVWSYQMQRCRRDLFSKSPVKRFAALGYIGGHPGVETHQLLVEYLRWESNQLLRKRAEKLLHRMQRLLV